MTYYTDPDVRKKIDALLQANASYQANNNCKTNSKVKSREINRYCNKAFIRPIKGLDPVFYEQISKQSD